MYFNSVTIIFAAGEPVTHSVLSDKSVYDYDEDMDELFNLSTYLIEKNPLAEPKEVRLPYFLILNQNSKLVTFDS